MAKKYIDAELLRKEIDKQMKSVPREVGRGAGTVTSTGYGMMQAFQIIRSIIDSLQQEQPCNRAIYLDVLFSNMKRNEAIKQLEYLNEVYGGQSCDTCTNDKGCVTCKDGELWEGKEQPSEGFEKEWDEFENWMESYSTSDYPTYYEPKQIARHFANWQKQQILKVAVEADVNTFTDLVVGKNWAEFVTEMPTNNLGDKVKIVIVPQKEDNKNEKI